VFSGTRQAFQATFKSDDLVTVTMGTKHGNEYHDTLLLKPSVAWHTWG